jgi:L-asparagine transporter-like permease
MSNSVSHFHAISEREKGLYKALSANQMSLIALGGAIGTGLFLGSGFAIGTAGPSVLLSYAFGAVIAVLLMGCLAEMTAAHPTTGSFGAYAEHYISPWAGFMARYAYWTCGILGIGTELTAIGVYMEYWFPNIPGWYWMVGFSLAMILINALSVKIFGTLESWMALIKIGAIVGFILLASYVVFGSPKTLSSIPGVSSSAGFHHYFEDGGFFPHGALGTWSGVVISIFSFIGIEMVAVAAGEAKEPGVAVAKAFRSTIVRLVLFYILTIALMLALLPWSSIAQGGSPFVRVLQATKIEHAAGIVNFILLIATLSAVNSQLYIATRMMFSLSRAGYAPRQLGKINSRGVPFSALIASCVGIVAAIALKLFYPDEALSIMISLVIFAALFTWLIIFVTHYFFRRRMDAQTSITARFKMRGFPALTIFGGISVASILVSTLMIDAFRMTIFFGVPFLLALSAIYFLWYRKPHFHKTASAALQPEQRTDAATVPAPWRAGSAQGADVASR